MPSLTLNRPSRRSRPIPAGMAPGLCPGHVVEMVMDAALRFLVAAEAGFAADPAAGVANVHRAQRILLELMGSLDRAVAPEITDTLLRVYQHLFDRLGEAAALEDVTLITEARVLLTGLRDAWAGAARTACSSHHPIPAALAAPAAPAASAAPVAPAAPSAPSALQPRRYPAKLPCPAV